MKELRDCTNILLVRDDRMGDVVLTTPVIEQVRKNCPKAKITFLTSPYTADLVRGNPHLDDVMVYDKRGAHRSVWAGIIGFSEVLRSRKFDAVVIFHPTTRMHLCAFLAGIPVRIGWDRKWGFLLTLREMHRKHEGEKHETEYNADLLKAAGLQIGVLSCVLPYDAIKRSGNVELAHHGILSDERYVVLGLGTSCPSKQWPLESYAEFARVIHREYPEANIAVLAGSGERALTDGFAKAYEDHFLDLTGVLSVSEIIVFMKEHGMLFVGNDSGLGHLASASGVPTVVVFGRNDCGLSPMRWKPLGQFSAFVHRPPNCLPCAAHACEKDFLCMTSVSPAEVWTAVEKVLPHGM